MHRLIRIEGLHDFKVGNTLKFVLYDGSKYITLKGYIHRSKFIDFDNHHDSVDQLFSGFGINNSLMYCKKFDTACSSGPFPEHSSLDALKKLFYHSLILILILQFLQSIRLETK